MIGTAPLRLLARAIEEELGKNVPIPLRHGGADDLLPRASRRCCRAPETSSGLQSLDGSSHPSDTRLDAIVGCKGWGSLDPILPIRYVYAGPRVNPVRSVGFTEMGTPACVSSAIIPSTASLGGP